MSRPFNLRAPRQSYEQPIQEKVAAMLWAYLPDAVWWTCSLSGVRLTPAMAGAAKRAGMNKGAPDLSFIWPDGRTTYVEVKGPDGVLTPEQKRLKATLGDDMVVCRSWPEVRAAVSPWLERHGLRWLTDTESVRREFARRQAARAAA